MLVSCLYASHDCTVLMGSTRAQGKLHAPAYVFHICRGRCYAHEQAHFTVRTWYYSQGTQIYCAPTVDARPLWQSTMTHIALEGRCFVLSACQFAQEKDYPADHAVANSEARDPNNVMIAGGSVIINPLGQVLAGPLLGEEGIITADLDMDDWYRGKFDLDTTGHYARNDGEWLSVGHSLVVECCAHGPAEVFQLRMVDPAVTSKTQ